VWLAVVAPEAELSHQCTYNLRGLGDGGFLGFCRLCSFTMLAVLQSVSPQCCQLTDLLCSSSQRPTYHFYKLLISSSDLLSFLFHFLIMFPIMFPMWLSFLLVKPGPFPFPPSILTSPLSGPGLVRRYTAVVKPVQYQYSTGQSSCRRVSLMIVIVWMLAFAVSCPLLFGFNTTGR